MVRKTPQFILGEKGMKKFLRMMALCSLLLLALLATVSCKNIMGKLPFGGNDEDTTTEETPTAPQEHSHAFGAWAVTKDATCTEKGMQERTCACGEKETMEISALGHAQVIDPAVSPTCTTDGLSVGMHCGTCGEVLLAQEVTPASHIWAQTELVRAATCFVAGEERRVCRTCNAEETAQIEVLEHNFVQDEETQLFACSICDARIFAGHLYATFEEIFCWFDAYQVCENMGGHLITITSAHEQAILTDMMNSELRAAKAYWIGGILVTNNFHWITGEHFEYQNWEPKQPNYANSNQHVLNTYSHLDTAPAGSWNDLVLTDKLGFVCEWDLEITECEHIFSEWETTCEATCWNDGEQYRICTYCGVEETEVLPQLTHHFVFVEETGMTSCEHCSAAKYNGHIYVLFTDTCGWFEAYSRCEALGGHLATITSEKEQTFVNSYLATLQYNERVWLGAYSIDKQWHWVTNEAFEYANWSNKEPSYGTGEYFVHLNYDTSGKWNDVGPQSKYAYLCEFDYEE